MSKRASKSTEELARQFRATTIPGDRSEPERYHRILDRVYGHESRPAISRSPSAAAGKKEAPGG